MNIQSENGQTLLTLLVAVALASLVLGGLALSRPLDRTVAKTANYSQSGTFSYSAPAPSGVYDADAVTTGDPIFTKITNNVDFRFAYQLTTTQAADVNGTAGMQAVISDSSGWKRSLQLLSPQAFTGTRFIAVGTLDLSQVRAVITQFEQTTGITSSQYSVSIVPTAQLHGTISGSKLDATYSPALKFTLDQDSLSLVDTDNSSDAGASSPLKPSQDGQVTYSAQAPNVLSLLTFSLSVGTARVAALSGLIIALFGLCWYGLLSFRGARADEPARIQSRYSALLIDVDDANFENTSRVIDVVRFEDLLRLAERGERMIMHQLYGGINRYYVQDEAITYRYRVAPRSEQSQDGRTRGRLATGDLR
jgi:hypothetical protein